MSGVHGVLSRIQELQTQLGMTPPATQATGAAGVRATQRASATGNAFAAQLGAVTRSTAATGSTTGNDVVAGARKYLGVPYVFGGTNPSTGLDCSGLIQRVYKDLGIKVPRLSWDQAKAGTAVNGLANAKPGDILGFNGNSHVGIYIGGGKMIHAPQPGEQVKIQDVYATPSAIRRIIPDAPVAPAATAAAVRPASLRSGVSGVPYANLFNTAAARYGVSAKLLAAVAKVESGYDAGAVSPAGARGLMQIMPATARELGVNAFDPAQAVDGAARLLRDHLKTFDGSLPLALAAYNAGAGAVRRYNGVPPFAETQAYVPKVQRALAALG